MLWASKKNDFKSADPNPYELGGTSKALGPFCMIWTQRPNPPTPISLLANRSWGGDVVYTNRFIMRDAWHIG